LESHDALQSGLTRNVYVMLTNDKLEDGVLFDLFADRQRDC
jgi:hypothetical protein